MSTADDGGYVESGGSVLPIWQAHSGDPVRVVTPLLGRSTGRWLRVSSILTSALLIVACGMGPHVAFEPTEAAISPDCPINENLRPDESREGRVFDVVFAFVSPLWMLEASRGHITPEDARSWEREARSQLTEGYDSHLTRLKDAGLPIHSGERAVSFTSDHAETRFGRGTATQEILYCFAGGGIWTQVFHLRRVGGEWEIDSIEPARRRAAS